MTIATGTANALSGDIPFGRFVSRVAGKDHSSCQLPNSSNATLKVVHATPTAENSAPYTIALIADLNFDGHRESYVATYDGGWFRHGAGNCGGVAGGA